MPASIPTTRGPPEFATEAIQSAPAGSNNDHLPWDMTEPRLESGEQVCDNLAASHGLTMAVSPQEHTAIDTVEQMLEQIVTAEDNTAAEQILQALVPVPHSAGLGGDAARGLLMTAAAEHRQHKFLASRLETEYSKSLQERKRIHESGGEGFDHHYPTQAEDEFNDFDVLFRVLSRALKKPRAVEGGKGWLERMPKYPKTATDPAEFHSKFGKPFGKDYDPPWLLMSMPQKRKRLHAFLFTKFSLDRKMQCMMPESHIQKKPRNDAGWKEFWLSDAELTTLVAETMEEYARVT